MPREELYTIKPLKGHVGSAKLSWERLRTLNTQTGINARMALRRKVTHLEMGSRESMKEYVSRCEALWGDLNNAKALTDSKEFCLAVLSGLPDDWENVAYDLDQVREAWTTQSVFHKLMEEAERRNERLESKSQPHRSTSAPTAFIGQKRDAAGYAGSRPYQTPRTSEDVRGMHKGQSSGPKRGKGQRFGTFRGRGRGPRGHGVPGRGVGGQRSTGDTCWYCKKSGHKWMGCPTKPTEWKPAQARANVAAQGSELHQPKIPEAWVAVAAEAFSTQSSEASDSEWVIDSGCTMHMTPNKEWFSKLEPPSYNCIVVGNGARVPVEGEGSVIITTSQGLSVSLDRVLYVPQLTVSLLSVSVMDKAGMEVSHKKGKCKIKREDGSVVVEGPLEGSLYKLKVNTMKHVVPKRGATEITGEVAMKAGASLWQSSETLATWHKRLAHVSPTTIQAMERRGVVTGMKVTPGGALECSSCVAGKMARTAFQESESHASRPLGLIHCDLSGRMHVPSREGSLYLMVIIDDHTRYTWSFPLKKKSDAHSIFKSWLIRAERQSGYRLKAFRTDGGGEFHGLSWLDELDQAGILKQDTNPYTLEQNGVVERANRTIVELAKACLVSAELHMDWWEQAALYVTWVKNRVTTRALAQGVTPYQMWEGDLPNVSMARPFGCMTQIMVPKEKRKKWYQNTQWGMFIGFQEGTKGWLFWLPEDQIYVTSRNAYFHEEMFLGDWKSASNKKLAELPNFDSNLFWLPAPPEGQAVAKEVPREKEKVPVAQRKDQAEEAGTITQKVAKKGTQGWRELPKRVQPPRLRVKAKWSGSALLIEGEQGTEGAYCYMTPLPSEPLTLRAALASNEAEKWRVAMQKELDALEVMDTWTLVPIPEKRNIVKNKWVFKIKTKGDGTLERFKARLVAKGFTQAPGLDYGETYAPVGRYATSRVLMCIASQKNWEIHQMDVSNAFLYGTLDEDIYMEQPTGFEDGTHRVCKLKKALYGLKQSPRMWNHKLDKVLEEMGFRTSALDPALYHLVDEKFELHMLVFVDDLLMCSSDMEVLKKVKKVLCSNFVMKDLGDVSYYLGLNIMRDRAKGDLWIGQPKYISKFLEKYDIAGESMEYTPLPSGFRALDPQELEGEKVSPMESPLLDERGKRHYQSMVGALNFASTCTRPDIAFATGQLAQSCQKPRARHEKAAERCLRYLVGTSELSLHYKGGEGLCLTGYSDSDWAGCKVTRKSTTGWIFLLAGAPVSWSSKKQTATAMSSCEAEYLALTSAIKECLWLRDLLAECGVVQDGPTVIHVDNEAAIKLSKNPVFHSRTKHVALAFQYAREQVQEGHVSITHVGTKEQAADTLTKNLPAEGHATGVLLAGQSNPDS